MHKLFSFIICCGLLLSTLQTQAQCDTLANVKMPTDTGTILQWTSYSNFPGYISGTGGLAIDTATFYPTVAVAERFTTQPQYVVNSATIGFGYCTILPADSFLPVKIYVYNDSGVSLFNTAKAPSSPIDSATITLAQVAQAVTASVSISGIVPVSVTFSNYVSIADTVFYIGVALPRVPGDSIVLLTDDGYSGHGRGWIEIDSTGGVSYPYGWLEYDSLLGQKIGVFITASACPGVLRVTMPATTGTCAGSNIILAPKVYGGKRPYTYAWSATGDALSCSTCANPSVTLTQNSTYSLTVTDALSTTVSASTIYLLNGATNSMGVSVSNPYRCYTGALVTVTGGTPQYTYDWGDGIGTAGPSGNYHSYNQPGPEVISVTDSNGCVSAVFDTVAAANIPVITLVSTVQPSCPGSYNGQIVISVSGGTPPYNIYWSDSTNSDTVYHASGSYYYAQVTDSAQCQATFGYSLNAMQDPGYYVYVSASNPNCGTTGLATATVGSGIPPYSYLWSTSETTVSITLASSGQFWVTVTDSLGCTTSGYTDIYSSCASIITGTVFVDSNGNCTKDAGEAGLPNVYVMATATNGDNYYGSADNNGNYVIQVYDTGTFTLSAPEWGSGACGNYVFCNNAPQTVYLGAVPDSSVNNNIGFVSTTGFNLGIHPGWTTADPGFTKQYWIFYYNSSPTPFTQNALITFTYDANLSYLSSDAPLPTTVDTLTHTLTWTVDSIDTLGGWGWERLDAYFQVPSTLSLSTLLQSDFRIDPTTGDCDSSDNHYHFTETVEGSHDPNEKDVEPANNISPDDSLLTYTIHFQNDGTAPTNFIVVKDTLSTNLDASSVHTIASSAKVSNFTITGKGILTWVFNPYSLPASSTDAAASKGFITFTVLKKKNLPLGTVISNTASIYFDYNTAVVTNTVADTVALPNGIIDLRTNNDISVKAFPNPFKDATNIQVSGLNQKYDFELYDVTGRLMRRIPSINTSQFQLQRDEMAAGMYLYRIVVNGTQSANGKLVVE